jgi:hypothetical protein
VLRDMRRLLLPLLLFSSSVWAEELHLKMNDDAASTTVDDSSSNNLDGTLNGGDNTSDKSVAGQINDALDLNGTDDFISVADNNALDFTNKMTIAVWYKPDALATNEGIVVKWDYQTQGSWALQTGDSNSDELYMFITDALDDAGLNGVQTSNANLAADGTWYHLVVVYDGEGADNAAKLKIYKNGTQLTTDAFDGTIPTSLQNSTASVKVGKFGGTLDRFNGAAFDDVRLYNIALTQTQIDTLYNSGTGTEDSLTSASGIKLEQGGFILTEDGNFLEIEGA